MAQVAERRSLSGAPSRRTGRERKPCGGRDRRPGGGRAKKPSSGRVTLEKVLGVTSLSSSGLTSDPNSGLVAYPAGCVIVLLHPTTNQQSHIINTSRKPFSAVAFSADGKHLVTGESGHMPRVCVWELDGRQAAEVQSHRHGVSCVAFSADGRYIVSVGHHHDMTVSVWEWRKGSIVASNKVSSRVWAVSFSQDSSYFVTAGKRHVKFWYLDASQEQQVNSTVPLIGRSGLLGDHKNSVFCGVACGRGLMASKTYCITSSALLCQFNSSRQLEAWVDLKAASASCLAVSEDLIFCGCGGGVVRVFSPSQLQFVCTLQQPHQLGLDLQDQPHSVLSSAQYPDTLALTFDPVARHLTCIYNDHSVYVWDVQDVRNSGKLYSALYHSGCVWSLQVNPHPSQESRLPPSSFLTCSSDGTIRLWRFEAPPTSPTNLYSNELLRMVHVGENTESLQADGGRAESAGADGKAGIRVMAVSPNGRHLAAGDCHGNLRIFDLEFLDELIKIEAHDSEVLCLEFSPASTGMKLLVSASRDRLIHIFNLEKNFSLEQTLNEHSACITALRFTGDGSVFGIASCGADKSIYFQTAEQTAEGVSFSRTHHVVEKTTLYDMDVDSSRTQVVIACQDRNVRVYNVESGKLKKCLKGSSSEEGSLLKVHMDPSGSFLATSCSDKTISIFDFESGECVATLLGHSEIVTCLRFSPDCTRLISASGDSCVFVWRLDDHMTNIMRKRLGQRSHTTSSADCSIKNIRRETFTIPSCQLPLVDADEEGEDVEQHRTPARLDCEEPPPLQTNGKLPMWVRKLGCGGASSTVQSEAGAELEPRQVRRRWAEPQNPTNAWCDLQIHPPRVTPSPTRSHEDEVEEEEDAEEEEDVEEEVEGAQFQPQSLEKLLREEEVLQTACEDCSDGASSREFEIQAVIDGQSSLTQMEVIRQGAGSASPVSSEGSRGPAEPQQDTDTDSQCSSLASLVMEDEEDRSPLKQHFDKLACSLTDEEFETDLQNLQPPDEKQFLNPRFSISTRFLSRFQERVRVLPSRAPPPISEESCLSNISVNSELSSNITSEESTNPGNIESLLATPTDGSSPGGGSGSTETAINETQLSILSPTPSLTPTATPTPCDSAIGQEDDPGRGTRRQSGSTWTRCHGDNESLCLQTCQCVANDLRETSRRAALLYEQLSVASINKELRLQMSAVLQETLEVVQAELGAVLVQLAQEKLDQK